MQCENCVTFWLRCKDLSNAGIRVIALSRRQYHHFEPISNAFTLVADESWTVETLRQQMPDVLLTLTDDWYESYVLVKEARKLGIPTLLIMDGIIEWRHIWDDPKYASGDGIAFYQPIQTDKVACLGWQSARTFEAWGNVGKCEVVGAPRFDHYLTEPIPPPTPHGEAKRLLIMTANTPGFTHEQISQVEQALADVRDFLHSQSNWQPIWRVRKGLDEKLGLDDSFSHLRGKPLRDVLAVADAVLTTPSTVLLESMLAHRPTALLDYSNSPPYVSAAWNITAQAHIVPTLESMYHPSASRLTYQDEILHNHLECFSPATPRVIELVRQMAEIGRKARAQNTALAFPSRMVSLELGGHAVPSEHFDWALLYPNHPAFTQTDTRALQVDLTHARSEIADLRRQLHKARQQTVLYALARRIFKR